MNGFLIINKQEGWTSHDVVAKARGILGTKKVGHLGTLDPLATGVLVLAVGKALKLVEFLMGCEKTYEAEIELGKVSDTYDYEGKVERQNVKGKMQIAKSELKKALESFEGEIEQMPPVYSALKIKGKTMKTEDRKKLKELKTKRKEIGDKICVKNIEFPEGVKPLIDPNIIIAIATETEKEEIEEQPKDQNEDTSKESQK